MQAQKCGLAIDKIIYQLVKQFFQTSGHFTQNGHANHDLCVMHVLMLISIIIKEIIGYYHLTYHRTNKEKGCVAPQ